MTIRRTNDSTCPNRFHCQRHDVAVVCVEVLGKTCRICRAEINVKHEERHLALGRRGQQDFFDAPNTINFRRLPIKSQLDLMKPNVMQLELEQSLLCKCCDAVALRHHELRDT